MDFEEIKEEQNSSLDSEELESFIKNYCKPNAVQIKTLNNEKNEEEGLPIIEETDCEEDCKNEELLHPQKKESASRKKATGDAIDKKISELKRLLRLPNFAGVVNSEGKIASPSSEIFVKLSKALTIKHRMQPKYIYTILLNNRYSAYSELLNFLKIDPQFREESLSDSTLNSTGDIHEFRIDVTKIWPSLQPETVLYKFRNRDRVIRRLRKNSWTHVLFEEIQNNTNLPCALNFKNNKTSGNSIFATVRASCPECPCEFFGRIPHEPKDGETVIMDCLVENFDRSIKHQKKRPLQGKLRTAVGNELIERNMLPCQHRRNEAHRLIQNVGDDSPPHLYKNNILGKAKQEGINQRLGVIGSKALDNLLQLKYSGKYGNSIRNIGLDPPYVYYWTREQQLIFEKFPQSLKIDASGCVVKTIILPNGEECSHIYIFQGVVEVNGKTIPVFQMLSSAQNTVAILNFLLEFRRVGAIENPNYPLPLEVITDFDKALLGAVSRAYGTVGSLKQYLNLCFTEILGGKINFPICILRLDICHYTQMIARWKCYPKHQPGVRTMYLRAMCILRKQDDFHEFEEIATAIFMLSLSKSGNKGSLASNAKEFLKEKIRGISDDLPEEVLHNPDKFEEMDEDDLTFDDNDQIESSTLGEWVQQLYLKVKTQADNERITNDDDVNGYQLPDFARKLKDLLFYFPIFTEIFRKIRGYGSVNATSASAESFFNDLKHRQFRFLGLPLRIDKFVVAHLLEIEKILKEAAAGCLTLTKEGDIEAVITSSEGVKRKGNFDKESKEPNLKYIKSSKIHRKEKSAQQGNSELKVLNSEHNWRNKNKKNILKKYASISEESGDDSCQHESQVEVTISADDSDDYVQRDVDKFRELQKNRQGNNRKRKGAQYGDPCPQFEPTLKKTTWLPILPNGSRCKNVRENSVVTVLSNTCAFDSILQIVSMAVGMHEYYTIATNDFTSNIFTCARILAKNKITARIFKERARTLRNSEVMKTSSIQQYTSKSDKLKCSIIQVNALCNVGELAHSLFLSTPSYTLQSTCTICKTNSSDAYVEAHIRLLTLKTAGIEHLAKALQLPPKNIKKKCCGKQLAVNICYGPHLLINADTGISNTVRLCDIPQRIQVSSNVEYKMAGIVAYQGIYDPNQSGHYVGYVSAGTFWLLHDDLSSSQSPKLVDNTEPVDPHILLYVKIPSV